LGGSFGQASLFVRNERTNPGKVELIRDLLSAVGNTIIIHSRVISIYFVGGGNVRGSFVHTVNAISCSHVREVRELDGRCLQKCDGGGQGEAMQCDECRRQIREDQQFKCDHGQVG
jgi:hypothetical protein